MMELTKANIDVGQVGEWEDPNTWQCTMQFFESKEEAEQVKQQLLNDYKKARKYDEVKDGTLGFIRAFNWLDENKSIFNKANKLRELVEKQKTNTKAILSDDSPNKEELQRLLNLFDYLLEASKK